MCVFVDMFLFVLLVFHAFCPLVFRHEDDDASSGSAAAMTRTRSKYHAIHLPDGRHSADGVVLESGSSHDRCASAAYVITLVKPRNTGGRKA